MSIGLSNITRPITSPVANPGELNVHKVYEHGRLQGYALTKKGRSTPVSPVRESPEQAWLDADFVVRIVGVGYLFIRPEQRY